MDDQPISPNVVLNTQKANPTVAPSSNSGNSQTSNTGSPLSQTGNSGFSQATNFAQPILTYNSGNQNNNGQQTVNSQSSIVSNEGSFNTGASASFPSTELPVSAPKFLSNSGVPPSLDQLNSIFGLNLRSPRANIPTQYSFTNYNTGNNPGAIVGNNVISSIKQANSNNTYGNLRINF